MKKLTIREVAKAAGVSYVTVSNVINETGRMKEETRQKVLKAIKKLNFHPHGSARTLARGKSDVIAFISDYLSSPFIIEVLAGVENRLLESGKFKHSLEHHSTRGLKLVKTKLLEDLLYGRKADAVIMLTVKPDNKMLKEFKRFKVPLVLIENSAPGVHSVHVDNYKGAYLATEYLIKKGRDKIALVTGPSGPTAHDEEENPVLRERMRGYIDALKQNNRDFDPKMVHNVLFFNQEDGVKVMVKIKEDNPDINAIFCAAGDLVAVGIIRQARSYGIRIPQDIALVGYDDIAIAAAMNPALTTVRQPLDDMGKAAFDLAIGSLEGKIKKSQHIMLTPELIIRESA